MKKRHLYLFAVLFLYGFGAADSQDPQSFPKGKLLPSGSEAGTTSLAGLPMNSRSLYSQRFNESIEGWALTDSWRMLHLPTANGSAAR